MIRQDGRDMRFGIDSRYNWERMELIWNFCVMRNVVLAKRQRSGWM